MRLLAFAASNSRNSINKKLVEHAAEKFKSAVQSDSEIEYLDLNDYELPIYSIDRENADGIPHLAQVFFDKITAADALLISFAEHNGAYCAAYKNIFDWMSRIDQKVYQSKPMINLATSPGPNGASNVLTVARSNAPHFGAELRAELSVPSFYQNFDLQSGQLIDPLLKEELLSALLKLKS